MCRKYSSKSRDIPFYDHMWCLVLNSFSISCTYSILQSYRDVLCIMSHYIYSTHNTYKTYQSNPYFQNTTMICFSTLMNDTLCKSCLKYLAVSSFWLLLFILGLNVLPLSLSLNFDSSNKTHHVFLVKVVVVWTCYNYFTDHSYYY